MKTLAVAMRVVIAVLAIAVPLIDADGCTPGETDSDVACCQRTASLPASAPDADHGCAGCLASCCHPLLAMPIVATLGVPAPLAPGVVSVPSEIPPAGLGVELLRPPILSA